MRGFISRGQIPKGGVISVKNHQAVFCSGCSWSIPTVDARESCRYTAPSPAFGIYSHRGLVGISLTANDIAHFSCSYFS